MHERSFAVPDPVAGKIQFPPWLIVIKDEPPVRRMLSIRQLGLKAYIDFPGAIHTRYSHALGTMQLAGRVVDILIEILRDTGKTRISDNLRSNRDDLMATGFLHDIGHGPFSHAVDFALEEITGKTHEEMAVSIISDHLPSELRTWIDTKKVVEIIKGDYLHPFISQIIDGPLDVDKLDYLLRDAYHVGLRYSFDLDNFLSHYSVIGSEDNLRECVLGLEDSQSAFVTADLFLVIWKSMYDLVYFAQSSRIAEKMLEKAILLCKNNPTIQGMFTDLNQFMDLHDEALFAILEKTDPKSCDIVKRIRRNDLYEMISESPLDEEHFQLSTDFISQATSKSGSKVADRLSVRLNEELGLQPYQVICDLITTKAPDEIQIDVSKPEDEPTLRGNSGIVSALIAKTTVKLYQDSSIDHKPEKAKVDRVLKELIEGWDGN